MTQVSTQRQIGLQPNAEEPSEVCYNFIEQLLPEITFVKAKTRLDSSKGIAYIKETCGDVDFEYIKLSIRHCMNIEIYENSPAEFIKYYGFKHDDVEALNIFCRTATLLVLADLNMLRKDRVDALKSSINRSIEALKVPENAEYLIDYTYIKNFYTAFVVDGDAYADVSAMVIEITLQDWLSDLGVITDSSDFYSAGMDIPDDVAEDELDVAYDVLYHRAETPEQKQMLAKHLDKLTMNEVVRYEQGDIDSYGNDLTTVESSY